MSNGFNIDVNKLNGEWKNIADRSDINKDNKINNDEISKLIQNALINKKSEQEITDFLNTNGASAPEVSKEVHEVKKKDAKDKQEYALSELSSQAGNFNGNWMDLANNMTATLIGGTQLSPQQRNYFSKLAAKIRTVAEAAQSQPIDTKENIEKLYNNVKKELKFNKDDELKDFALEVLESFVDIAEARQKGIENGKLTQKFSELRSEGKTRKQAYDAIKKDNAFKGSYYEFPLEDGTTKTYAKDGLVQNMKDGVLLEDAREKVWDVIENQRGKGITDSKDLENAVRKDLENSKELDKYTKKVLRGELSFGEKINWDRSKVKAYRKSVAAFNRAEEIKKNGVSEADIKQALKTDAAFTGLTNSLVTLNDELGLPIKDEKENIKQEPLITKNADGTYNVTNLSNLIMRRIGADMRANRQNRNFETLDEVENIMNELNVSITPPLSKKDVKRLIKLCGFDVETKNWWKVFTDALTNTAIGTAATAVGTLATDITANAKYIGPEAAFLNYILEQKIPVSVIVNKAFEGTITFEIGGISEDDYDFDPSKIIYDLRNQGFEAHLNDDTPNKYIYTFSKDPNKIFSDATYDWIGKMRKKSGLSKKPDWDNQKDYDVKTKYDVVGAVAKSMLVGFALNFLQAAIKEQGGEFPAIKTQFSTNDINQYLAELKQTKGMGPALFNGLKSLANAYVRDDGTWDSDGYKRFLNAKFAGDGSVLNSRELLIGIENWSREQKAKAEQSSEQPKVQDTIPAAPKPEQPVEVKEAAEPNSPQKTEKDGYDYYKRTTTETKNIKQTDFNAWVDVVKGYNLQDNKVARRMMKILQVIKDPTDDKMKTVYTIENLKAFAEIAISKGYDNAIKEFPDFKIDKDKYLAILKAGAGIIDNGHAGKVLVPTLYDNDATEHVWREPRQSRVKTGGKKSVSSRTEEYSTSHTEYQRVKQGNKPDGKDWQKINEEEYNKNNQK